MSQSPLKLIGQDIVYSSWTLRPVFLLEHFGIPYELECFLDHPSGSKESLKIKSKSPSGLVPVLLLPHPTKTGEVVAVNDSLAIFETISDLYSPDLAIWPRSKYHRALARSACAEFHSGFGALRGALPCNLRRVAKEPKEIDEAVKKDARRVCEIWEGCRKAFEDAGLRDGADVNDDGWLFGQFSAVDAFMIVVASRFRTYRVEIPEEFPKAKAWMDRVWKDETVKKMVNKAVEDELVLEKYDAYAGDSEVVRL